MSDAGSKTGVTAGITQLPSFDSLGNIPAGDYHPTKAEFEARFVDVPGSSTRHVIYSGYQKHCADLGAAGVSSDARSLLDGSFTTSKTDPGDIDLVVEVEERAYLNSRRVQTLLSGPGAKPDYYCDAYPLLVLDTNHPDYDRVTRSGRDYWRKWFGTDRKGNPKGRVWSTVGGSP